MSAARHTGSTPDALVANGTRQARTGGEAPPELAIIGGTGLYQLQSLRDQHAHVATTPYGAPSSPIVLGNLGGVRVAFLARHGESHSILPHRVNYRANVWALHAIGARSVIGINAVGGIRSDMGPRTLVLPHQLIDYTHGRASSFADMDDAEVRHIDFSAPYTERLREKLMAAARVADIPLVADGVYATTQGPRLETVAEVARMRRDGCDLVGMTGMPEAALARELGLEYACVALVANWAAGCGPAGEAPAAEISIEEIHGHLEHATGAVPPLLEAMLRNID